MGSLREVTGQYVVVNVDVTISVAPESFVVVITRVRVSVAILDESAVSPVASDEVVGKLVADPIDTYSSRVADRLPNEEKTIELPVNVDISGDE